MHAIVTGFFDINRENWKTYKRDNKTYFENAKRLFQTPEDMIVFISKDLVDFVKSNRNPEYKTYIIPCEYNELYYASYEPKIKEIMDSQQFKKGLKAPDCPECFKPKYNVIMWSKLPLIQRASELYPEYTHFAWVDFGIHSHILTKLGQPIYSKGIKNIVKLHCLLKIDSKIDIQAYFKAQETKLAGGSITGSKENLSLFNYLMKYEIDTIMDKGLVGSDQSFFTLIVSKYPWLFELSYGNWEDIFTNYYEVKNNKHYILEKIGPSAFNYKGRKIVLVVPTGSFNIGNEFIGAGMVNLIKSVNMGAEIYIFQSERGHNVFLPEEIQFINSCDILIYGGGSIIGNFCFNEFAHTLSNITIPKILIGAGLSQYNLPNYQNIIRNFYNVFTHIVTRDDFTFNIIRKYTNNVSSGIDLAFFAGDNLTLPKQKLPYTLSNVEVSETAVPATYKIVNKYDSVNHKYLGTGQYLSHGYWETLYSLYANASFVETSRVHTFLVCISNGVKARYKNNDKKSADRHSLFAKIGLDLTQKDTVMENEYVDEIFKRKKEMTNFMSKLIPEFLY